MTCLRVSSLKMLMLQIYKILKHHKVDHFKEAFHNDVDENSIEKVSKLLTSQAEIRFE